MGCLIHPSHELRTERKGWGMAASRLIFNSLLFSHTTTLNSKGVWENSSLVLRNKSRTDFNGQLAVSTTTHASGHDILMYALYSHTHIILFSPLLMHTAQSPGPLGHIQFSHQAER